MTKLPRFAATAAALIAVSMTTGASAERKSFSTAEIGGKGSGTKYGWSCNGTDFMVGFDYSSGKALNNIIPVCQPQRSGKWTSDKQYHLTQVLGGGNAKDISGPLPSAKFGIDPCGGSKSCSDTPRCAKDTFIDSIHVWWDQNGDVHHVQAFCHDSSHHSENSFVTLNQGGQPNSTEKVVCSSEYPYAIGLRGTYSSLVLRMGLLCGKF
jgi:hypothetical protein